jgi:beta-glucosidase
VYYECDYSRNLVNDTDLYTMTAPDAWKVYFVEQNLINYKEFDARNVSVAFEFSYRLSYTTF